MKEADLKVTHCISPSDILEKAQSQEWRADQCCEGTAWGKREGWIEGQYMRALFEEMDLFCILIGAVNTQLDAFVETHRTVHHKE